MSAFAVRRVREDDWPRVRVLRIAAVNDPAAPIAFLSTPVQEEARDGEYWRRRAADAAVGESTAQFIAESGPEWVGTATVLVRTGGAVDHTGRPVRRRRADVVGVYVLPDHRGGGVIDALLDAAADWAGSLGLSQLRLDVHADNARAQAAYRRNGFVPTGERFVSSIGPELVMARGL